MELRIGDDKDVQPIVNGVEVDGYVMKQRVNLKLINCNSSKVRHHVSMV